MKNKILTNIFAIFLGVLLHSCSGTTPFYIDIKKQAIVSCKGIGLKGITIENEFEKITIEGTSSIIYFNQVIDASRVRISDSVIDGYKLVLRPNCDYEIRTDLGSDRPQFKVTFKTDSLRKVVQASREDCQ